MSAIQGLPSAAKRPVIAVAVKDGRRLWASGRLPSIAEQVAAMAMPVETYPIFRVRPCLLDADVIIRQVLASVRRGHAAALVEPTETGGLRSYAALQVVGEVDRRLSRAALSAHVDREAAHEVWGALREAIRHIDVPVEALAAASARDGTDAPTAYLSTIIGSAWTWSYDLDLLECALARPYDLALALQIRRAAEQERAFHAATVAATVLAQALFDAGRFVLLQASRRPWLAFLLGAAIALGVERLVRSRPELRERLAPLRQAAEFAARDMTEKLQSYAEALAGVAPTPEVTADTPLTVAIGRVLAIAPVPLGAREVTGALWECGLAASELEVRRALSSSTIFVRTGIGRWQLGWW